MAKTPVQDRSRDRVARMVVAFAELLDEVGYDQATTTAVAQRSGSAVGSVYQFFRNRDELAEALRDRLAFILVDKTVERMEKRESTNKDAADKVTLSECFADLHRAMEDMHRNQAGATHVPVRAPWVAQELAPLFKPYCAHPDEDIYSYVLVAVASSAACVKAALADPAHGMDILGLCQWSLEELGRDV